jgi:hypothetical protein
MPSRPSLAQVKAVAQPESVMGRANSEHWAGALYMRNVSPYVTRWLAPTRVTPDAVTWGMLVCGLLAAAALTIPGLWGAALCVLFIQGQLLLDCADGELARWRGTSSPVGVYLDRIGHYVTESALPLALGIRADGGWDSIGGWTTLGLLCSVGHLLNKAETDLVHTARALGGLPPARDAAEVTRPRRGGLARLRSIARFVPFFRAFVAVEFSFLVLLAAVGDSIVGGLDVTRGLLVVLVPTAFVIAAGHLAGILASSRLRS